MNYLINGTFVEFAGPQAKPWLVRLPAFRMGPRLERWTGRVRDEIEAVLPELVDEHGEFTMRELMTRLNPVNAERRRWAVEKAVWRLARVPAGSITLRGLGHGRWQVGGEATWSSVRRGGGRSDDDVVDPVDCFGQTQ